jgi:hypothetical protein
MAATASSSALFAPYRTVGQVTDGAQMSLYNLGSETFFVTPIQNAFQVYNVEHLSVALISRPLRQSIR